MWLHYPRSGVLPKLCLAIWYFPSEAWERETTQLVYRSSLLAPLLAGGAWGEASRLCSPPDALTSSGDTSYLPGDQAAPYTFILYNANIHETSSCSKFAKLAFQSSAIGGFWTFALFKEMKCVNNSHFCLYSTGSWCLDPLMNCSLWQFLASHPSNVFWLAEIAPMCGKVLNAFLKSKEIMSIQLG